MNWAIETRSGQPSARVVAKPQKPEVEIASKKKLNGAAEGSEAARYRAKRLFDEKGLTDEALAVALDKKDYEFVVAALALRASIPMPAVERMVRVVSVKTILALAWKGGFSSRFAMYLQRDLAFIAPKQIMNARDGRDFPMRAKDMEPSCRLFAILPAQLKYNLGRRPAEHFLKLRNRVET